MNKKLLSVALSVFMLFGVVDFSFAAKKDVADPVLQQIISELNDRMPRFINKYGAAIFVADEQITRGALLQALYEFDKKSSNSSSAAVSAASSSGVISKKDYDALNAKIAALEKKVKSPSGSGGKVDVDMVQLMNDLEPNLPMMLDNTLSSSKVFKDLEAKVKSGGVSGSAAVSSSGSGVSQAVITSLQKNIGELNTKVNSMETMLAKNTDSKSNVSASVLKDLKTNVDELNKKFNTMETTLAKKSDSKSDISKLALTDMQKSISEMNSKINNVESSLASLGKDGSKVGSSANNAQVMYEMKNFRNDINTVNKKLEDMEEKLAKTKSDSSSSSSPSKEDVASLKKTLVQMQQSYVTLGKRLDNIEKEQTLLASSSSGSSSASLSDKQMKIINSKINSIREDVDSIKIDTSKASSDKSSADIKRIEKRLSNLENTDRSSSSSGSSSDSGSSKTSTVAKVSLGLSLVAALFIAR